MNNEGLRVSVFCLAMAFAGAVAAQAPVGSIAGVDGNAEIQHDGAWQPATVGASVSSSDVLRTGPDGRLRIVFDAHSVLLVAGDSEVAVDEVSLQPLRTRLRLLRGKARALVGDAFTAPDAAYAIDTAVAVATVRGTDFIIVFDPVAAVEMPAAGRGRTDVVGVDGRVEVHSVVDRLHQGVFVTAYERAIVEAGGIPAPPQRLEENLFKQYIEGLEFIGGAGSASAARGSSLAAGQTVPGALAADAVAGAASGAAPGFSHPAAPGEGGEGAGADTTAPVTNQPPRASVLSGGGLDVDF